MKSKIFVNQVGYISELQKIAVVTNIGSAKYVICREGEKSPVYMSRLSGTQSDAASGDIVSIADFTEFREQGRFYIKVGTYSSPVFSINDNPYEELNKAVLKSFYYARCGMDLTPAFAGKFKRKKCHTHTAACFSDPQKPKRDLSGGWHDSGDYGRCAITGAVACAELLYAYEMFKDGLTFQVGLPESGSVLPDILEEVKYELKWLLKLQSADGGVYHKVSAVHPAENVMPADDDDDMFYFDCSAGATASLAAVCALASRIYAEFDLRFSRDLKNAALSAWVWIVNSNGHADIFVNPKGVTSAEYSDANNSNKIFWAACELYRLTGEKSFHKKLCSLYHKIDTTSFQWHSCGGFGALSYIFTDNEEKDTVIADALKTAFIFKADMIVSMQNHSGYLAAKEGGCYYWGSNGEMMTYAMTLIIADRFVPNKAYRIAALEQLNYVLGKNPMGICYITGFGEYSCMRPHHRPSTADEIDEPIPGMMAGGPDMMRSDDYSRWLIPKGTPPAKCYIDKEYSYATNQVTIYWNAAAAFVLSYFKKEDNGDGNAENGSPQNDKKTGR